MVGAGEVDCRIPQAPAGRGSQADRQALCPSLEGCIRAGGGVEGHGVGVTLKVRDFHSIDRELAANSHDTRKTPQTHQPSGGFWDRTHG